MRPKSGLFRLTHLSLATLALGGLVFLPLNKPSLQPLVLSATTSIPKVPIFDGSRVPEISALGIMIAEPLSGSILYSLGQDQRFYPASTTKIATALVALSVYKEDQVLEVGEGIRAAGNKVKFQPGEKLTVKSLLYGLLIPSGNDAAFVLADNYPDGGYSGFVTRMNQYLIELGLTNTHFTNPSGVINPDHYTSVKDLTLLASYVIRQPLLRQIVETKSAKIYDVTGQISHTLESTNQLLGQDGIKGLKTGWTPESGECLITYVVRHEMPLIVTVLNSKDRFGDSSKLIDWAYKAYSY